MNKVTYLSALALLAVGAAPSANAITWDFSNFGAGDLGSYTKTFTAGGQSITAYGSTLALAHVDLWYKNDGSSEEGLGLANDPQHEIIAGNFISLLMPTSFARTYDLTLDSLQSPPSSNPGETANIYECSSATNTGCKLLASLTGPPVEKDVFVTLGAGFNYLEVTDAAGGGGANVLLEAISSVPEPATLSLLGLGLAGVGFVRRKRTS